MDLASRGAAPSASAGMAGIGAGRSGLQTAYRPYYSGDNRSHHDYSSAAQWSNFDSSQHVDPHSLMEPSQAQLQSHHSILSRTALMP